MHKIKMYKNQVQIISGTQVCLTIVHAQARKIPTLSREEDIESYH